MRIEITTEIRLMSDRGEVLNGESFEVDTHYGDKWAVKNLIDVMAKQLWDCFLSLLKTV